MIEQLQSLMKALEAGSYNAQAQAQEKQVEKPTNTRNFGGKCKITVTDIETGEKLLDTEGYMKNYSIRSTSRGEPIHVMGGFNAVEYIAAPERELSFTAILTAPFKVFKEESAETTDHYLSRAVGDQPKPEYFKKACVHSWKTYEGFMETYEYCATCNQRRT